MHTFLSRLSSGESTKSKHSDSTCQPLRLQIQFEIYPSRGNRPRQEHATWLAQPDAEEGEGSRGASWAGTPCPVETVSLWLSRTPELEQKVLSPLLGAPTRLGPHGQWADACQTPAILSGSLTPVPRAQRPEGNVLRNPNTRLRRKTATPQDRKAEKGRKRKTLTGDLHTCLVFPNARKT